MNTATLNATADNIHNLSETLAEKYKTASKKPLTSFGYWARTAALVLLFAAVAVAVAFGIHFGLGFIATMGLSEMATIALNVILTLAGYLAAGFVGLYTGNGLVELYVRRVTTKASAKAAE